jgi:hypothetical protein
MDSNPDERRTVRSESEVPAHFLTVQVRLLQVSMFIADVVFH